MRRRVVGLAGSVAVAAAVGCTSAPEPPSPPVAVVRLSERYERPTGSVDEATAREVVDRRMPLYEALEALAGIAFLRDVIAEAASAEQADPQLAIDVQGALEVHAPCPGWDAEAMPREAETGFIELVIGVDASRVQRAFTGRTRNCQFVAERGKHGPKLTASMTMELDLGRSLGLGEPVPSLLIRATELSSELEAAVDGFQLDEGTDVLSLRVGDDDRLETLLELESLDIGQSGTLLLALHEDDRMGVRGREGEWICGRKRREPCVRAD
jgi:hypothetical protein